MNSKRASVKGGTKPRSESTRSRRHRSSSSGSCSGSETVQEYETLFRPHRQEVQMSERHTALWNMFNHNEQSRKSAQKKLPRKPVPSKVPQPLVTVRSESLQVAVRSTGNKSLEQCRGQQMAEGSRKEQLAKNSQMEKLAEKTQREQLAESRKKQLAESSQKEELAKRRNSQQLPEQSRARQVPIYNVLPLRLVNKSNRPQKIFIEVMIIDDGQNQLMQNLEDFEGDPCGRETDESSDDDGSLGPRMVLVGVVDGKQLQFPTCGRIICPARIVPTARPTGRDSHEAALRVPCQGARTATRQAGQALPQSVGEQKQPARSHSERPARKLSHSYARRAPTPHNTVDSPYPTTDRKPTPSAGNELIRSRGTKPKTAKGRHGHHNPFVVIAAPPKRPAVNEPALSDREASLPAWARQSSCMKDGKIDKSNYRRCQFCGREFINTSLLHHEKICETNVPVKTIRKWNRMHFMPKK